MKDILTESELNFLRSQGLGPDDVLDVRGYPQWLWFQEIKEKGKTIALGSKCRKAGHRLRSTKGHCVQCDTKILAFAGRFRRRKTERRWPPLPLMRPAANVWMVR